MRVLEVGPGTNRSYTFKPRAPVNSAGSLFPPPLRKILCVVLNLMLDEIRLRGVKP